MRRFNLGIALLFLLSVNSVAHANSKNWVTDVNLQKCISKAIRGNVNRWNDLHVNHILNHTGPVICDGNNTTNGIGKIRSLNGLILLRKASYLNFQNNLLTHNSIPGSLRFIRSIGLKGNNSLQSVCRYWFNYANEGDRRHRCMRHFSWYQDIFKAFKDENLMSCVANHLNVPKIYVASPNQLENSSAITSLSCPFYGIESTDGLQKLTNTLYFNLIGNFQSNPWIARDCAVSSMHLSRACKEHFEWYWRTQPNRKKGVGHFYDPDEDPTGIKARRASKKINELNVNWYYTWSGNPIPGVDASIEFVPMLTVDHWNLQPPSDITSNYPIGTIERLLIINEPHTENVPIHRAEGSLNDILDFWYQYNWYVRYPTGKASSVAMAGIDGEILQDIDSGVERYRTHTNKFKTFMNGILSVDKKLDFIATHLYCNYHNENWGQNGHAIRNDTVERCHHNSSGVEVCNDVDHNASRSNYNNLNKDDKFNFNRGVSCVTDQLDALWEKYRLPIWITEMGVCEWFFQRGHGTDIPNFPGTEADTSYVNKNMLSTSDVDAFMRDLIPELESRPYVQGYAWFGAGNFQKENCRPSRLYFDSLTRESDGYRYYDMTDLGHTYQSLAIPQ